MLKLGKNILRKKVSTNSERLKVKSLVYAMLKIKYLVEFLLTLEK